MTYRVTRGPIPNTVAGELPSGCVLRGVLGSCSKIEKWQKAHRVTLEGRAPRLCGRRLLPHNRSPISLSARLNHHVGKS
jgi:hypothetical protein